MAAVPSTSHPSRRFTRVIELILSEYVTTDLSPADVDVRADMTDFPFRGRPVGPGHRRARVEHVTDDVIAMRELQRVLSPGAPRS